MERDTLLKAIIGLSVIGLAIASYQTYEHYFLTSGFCDLSATFSCSAVTGTRFGVFPPSVQGGIATAAWGVVWWLGLIALSAGSLKGKEWFKDQAFYIFSYVVAGLGFVAYLLTAELYIIPKETGVPTIFEYVAALGAVRPPSICPFCTVQHILMVFLLLPLSYMLLQKPVKAYLSDIFYTEG